MSEKRNLSNILTKKIIGILEYQKIKFITTFDLINLINKYTDSKDPLQLIKYLKKQKRLISIKRNIYLYNSVSSLNNKVGVSEFEVNEAYLDGESYYIGLLNAYNHHKLTTQLSNQLFVFNTKYNIEKKIFNFKIKYIQINKKVFFGIVKGKYLYSDLEKTIIDVLQYFKYIDKLENIINNIIKNKDLINEKKLISYAKKYKSIKLLKLIGIITDNKELYNYLNKKDKFRYYTKIRNSGSKKWYRKWKIILI